MRSDNPLLGAPNTYITPHIAWAPVETRIRLIQAAADNIGAFLRGERLNRVD
jgi:glycerate dehydrogenase